MGIDLVTSLRAARFAITAAMISICATLIHEAAFADSDRSFLEKINPQQIGAACSSAMTKAVVAFFLLYAYYTSPSQNVYLLDFYCFIRPKEYLCSHAKLLKAFRSVNYHSDKVLDWFEKLMTNSGLCWEETVIPTAVLDQIKSKSEKMEYSVVLEETERVCFDVVQNLLEKTGVRPSEIDIIITTLSCFTPTPSLAAMLINKFGIKAEVLAYSLGGMGCSASVVAVDMAKHLLKSNPNKLALLVHHENVCNNTYTGSEPSMMITNAIFRMGGAAVLLSNRPKDVKRAKYQLTFSQRSHFAAEDAAFSCMGIKQDVAGKQGVYLQKDVVEVAATALSKHIKSVAPKILTLRELAKCAFDKQRRAAPEFGEAFDYILLHCGGKAIIDSLEKGLRLAIHQTQPTRDTLFRFGNTSSASTWYVLSRIESTTGIKKGSRIWHLSFGGGFKVNTAIWKARRTVRDQHPCWK